MTLAILFFICVAIFLFFLGKRWGGKLDALLLVFGWLVKCVAGIGFIYVYTYYYGEGKLSEDTGAFFREAKILADVQRENPNDYSALFWEKENCEELISHYYQNNPNTRFSRQTHIINDTRNQIKLISILMLLFNDNTHLIFVLFFFLSYLGLLVLFKTIKDNSKIQPWKVFTLLLFTPSILFWTSNNLKEPLYMLGLSFLLAFVFTRQKKMQAYMLFLTGLLLLLLFKPLLLIIIVVALILVILFQKIVLEKRKWLALLTLVAVGIILFTSIPSQALKKVSDKQFDFMNVGRGGYQLAGDTCFYYVAKNRTPDLLFKDSVVELKKPIPVVANLFGKIRNEKKLTLYPNSEQLTFIYFQKGGGSTFDLTPINNQWSNLFLVVPEGIFNSFFRPLPWGNDFSYLNLFFFLENLFFIGLLFLTVKQLITASNQVKITVSVLLLCVFILAIVIGVVTSVSGAILRYHIPMQLLIIIAFLLTKQKNEHAT
ncbi:MAG: hypothetical protein WC044_13750 [Crocinitomicaceae bacterium]